METWKEHILSWHNQSALFWMAPHQENAGLFIFCPFLLLVCGEDCHFQWKDKEEMWTSLWRAECKLNRETWTVSNFTPMTRSRAAESYSWAHNGPVLLNF